MGRQKSATRLRGEQKVLDGLEAEAEGKARLLKAKSRERSGECDKDWDKNQEQEKQRSRARSRAESNDMDGNKEPQELTDDQQRLPNQSTQHDQPPQLRQMAQPTSSSRTSEAALPHPTSPSSQQPCYYHAGRSSNTTAINSSLDAHRPGVLQAT